MRALITPIFVFVTCLVYGQNFNYDSAAHAFIEHMDEGKVSQIFERLTPTVQQALPIERLSQTWSGIKMQIGEFESMDSPRVEKVGEMMVSKSPCKFTAAEVILLLSYTTDYKISGLRIMPPEPAKSKYQPAEYVDPALFMEQDTTLQSEAGQIPAKIISPKGVDDYPIVVIVHGSGPNDEDGTMGDNKPLKDLAIGLGSKGIGSIRYVKRTKAYPQFFDKPYTIQEVVVDDALEAIRMANSITNGKVYLLGHSLGGMLAPKIASQTDKLNGAIIMAGNVRPLYELMIDQVDYLVQEPNKPEAMIKQLEEMKKAAIRIKNKDYDKDTPKIDLIQNPPSFWEDFITYDPIATAETLSIPMLILQGERDYQVTMAKEFALWKEGLNPEKTSFVSYPKLNHLMMEGEGKPNSAEYAIPNHIPEYVINDIANWIINK